MRFGWLFSFSLLGLLALSSNSVLANTAEALQQLKNGQAMLLMRHSLAPGSGEPRNFELHLCPNQRNLSRSGQQQAEQWSQFLRSHGINRATVYSSQYCRALDTGRFMNMGEVQRLPALNNVRLNPENTRTQTAELRRFIQQQQITEQPLIFISHQVNITDFAGGFLRENEAYIIALPLQDRPKILARIAP